MPHRTYSCPACTRIFVEALDGPTAPQHRDSLTGKPCPTFVPVYVVMED